MSPDFLATMGRATRSLRLTGHGVIRCSLTSLGSPRFRKNHPCRLSVKALKKHTCEIEQVFRVFPSKESGVGTVVAIFAHYRCQSSEGLGQLPMGN